MNINENYPVTQGKIDELKNRIKVLQIDLSEIEESFTRGGGKGGQKINKSSNCVVLLSKKYNIVVRVQRERQRSLNRFLALREMVDQIEMIISPQTSQRLRKIEKIRKQKNRRHRRQKKYA